MNVKLRLLLLVGLFFLAMTAGVLGLRYSESEYLQVLYRDRTEQVEHSMLSLLRLNSKLLEQVANDFARSEGLYTIGANGRIQAVSEDLRVEVAQKDISAAWVFTARGEQVFFAAHPNSGLSAAPFAFSDAAFRAVGQSEGNLHFFQQAGDGGVYEFYAAPIRPRLNPPAGASPAGLLFVARHWDDPYLANLSELLGGKARLVPLTQISQPAPSWLGDVSREVILQYPLVSWDGQPLVVVLEAHFVLPIVDAVLGILDRDTALNILLAFAFAAAFGMSIYHWVYQPVEKISASLESGMAQPLADLVNSRTEFGNMARLIQHSFQLQNAMDTEIERRKLVESALRDSEATYRALVDFSIQGFAVFQDGRIVFSNTALAEGLGYTQKAFAALPGNPVMSLFHPSDQAAVREYLSNCPENPLPDQRKKVRMVRKDGSVCWMEILASPVDHNGEPALQVAFLDVTKRELAEQAYRHEQEFALAILNTVKSIIVVLDQEGRLVRSNPACEQATGFQMSDMQARPFWELFRAQDDAQDGKNDVLQLIAEQSVVVRERMYQVPHGPARAIAWSNGFIMNESGQVRYMVGTGVDVTERKQRERQQAAIAALASALRGMLTRAEILQIIVDQATQFLQCDVVTIEMRRPETRLLVVERVTGQLAPGLRGSSAPEEAGMGGRVLQTREPFLSNELDANPDLLPEELRGKICAGVWVPLVAEGRPLGLLFAGSQRIIDSSDFHLLVSIADIAASSIHRCLLSEEMQAQLQRLTALHTINVAINASLDVRVTLQLLVSQITSQLGVDACDVLLIDPTTRDLKYVAGYGFASREAEKMRFWLGEGKAGQVALYRRPAALFDLQGIAESFPQSPWMAKENFVAYHAVPLSIKGEVKGVLETFHRAPYIEDPEWPGFLESLAIQVSIAINNADLLERLQYSNQELKQAYDATIEGWARALELRDEETEGHTQRVTEWTVRLAQGMGIGGDELLHIRRGALMHDIGKMGIPDSILRKKGPLDEDEWVIMRRHPQMAFDMMAPINFLRPATAIPFSHHERWNGSGYPQKLSGNQIPLAARIFAVVDVWDALYRGRPYRPPMPEPEVLDYLRQEAGRLFDPDVVTAFVEMRTVMEKHA